MNKNLLLCCACLSIFIISCKTFGGVPKETAPLDYSSEDVVKNEILRITELKQTEPVEAYWRALLLGKEEVIEECAAYLSDCADSSVEAKDYVSACRYLSSLETTGRNAKNLSFEKINELFMNDVPGFAENACAPSNISECVKATVTIIVDKGIKITYGTGIPDKVLGSGFFIDKRGYLITNHHVISDMVDPAFEGYSRLYIKLSGNEDDLIPAKVIGWDSEMDLALLKTEIVPEFVFSLGSSEDLSVGDKINVIGAPLGLESSLSEGVVSNTKRKLFSSGDVFQIDAPVNSGNSGGPCIDKNRKVQAVVFAGVLQSQGLNFAIPVEYLKQELPFLYSGGAYNHSWTGCYGHTKRENGKKTGVEVQYVMPGSSSRLNGFRGGEVIQKVNGKTVTTLEKFQSELRNYTPGTIVQLEYLNSFGSSEKSFMYLSKRSKNPSLEIYESDLIENSFLPLFGMQLVPASTSQRNTYKITSVIENTDAFEMKFSENDPVVIKKIKIDEENEYILAQIVTRRHKKNVIDVVMVLGSSFDGPNYF